MHLSYNSAQNFLIDRGRGGSVVRGTGWSSLGQGLIPSILSDDSQLPVTPVAGLLTPLASAGVHTHK